MMNSKRDKAVIRRDILEKFRLVPIFSKLQYEIQELSDGTCRIHMPWERGYTGSYESFHGGLLMTVADSAAYCAVLSLTGPDTRAATVDMSIRFLEPCLTDATAVATVIKRGRTLCPVGVDLFDDSGTKVAVAQVTYMVLS